MTYQYVREPLTAEEADRLANACETPTEQLIVWTLLDTGLRVGELCDLTSKDVLWQQRQLRVRGKGGPYGKKSKVRAFVEHVFARQKGPMGLVIRTIGLARATMKIGLANLTYNMKRMIWLMDRLATA